MCWSRSELIHNLYKIYVATLAQEIVVTRTRPNNIHAGLHCSNFFTTELFTTLSSFSGRFPDQAVQTFRHTSTNEHFKVKLYSHQSAIVEERTQTRSAIRVQVNFL